MRYRSDFDLGIILLVWTFIDTLLSKFGSLDHLADTVSRQI